MAILSEHERRKRTVADENGNHIPISEWTHADSVELPNGLNLAESVVYLTQAEYDALGDEKYTNNVDYYITDGTISYNGTVVNDVAIPLLLDNWNLNEENNTYYQTVTVEGLSEDSNPIIVMSPVGETPTTEELNAFNCLTNDITVANNSITFTAKELPSMSFTVVAKGSTANGDAVATVTELVAKVSKMEQDMINKVDTTDTRLSDARTPLEHNHDNIYYTETEIDSKFDEVNQNVSDNADAIGQINSDLFGWTSQTATVISSLSNVSDSGDITMPIDGYVMFALSKNDSDVRAVMTINGQIMLRRAFYKPNVEYSEWIPIKKGTIFNIKLYENTNTNNPLNVNNLWINYIGI